jgi:hypothetical protein
MQLVKAAKSKMLPHFLVVFNSVLLVLIVELNLNLVVVVTGAVADGGVKVLTVFHLWMPLFSIGLSPLFYRIRREGVTEKAIIIISAMVVVFSSVNIGFHFVDNFVLFTKAAEVATWALYSVMFSMSIYKILAALVLRSSMGDTGKPK